MPTLGIPIMDTNDVIKYIIIIIIYYNMCKNTKKLKYKKINRNKKKKSMKNKIKYGGKIIAQGTHGMIIIDDNNENYVYKIFNKLKVKNCDKLYNEFELQQRLHNELLKDNSHIYVPNCSDYNENQDKCSYKMERIFPLDNIGKYFIINMNDDNMNSIFMHSEKYGKQVGANILSNYLDINKVSFNIGKLFSKLHFVMNIDGYDCELLYGIINGLKRIILIDYDKANTFEWKLGTKIYRKIDETTIEEKILSTNTKFAWFLYSAMISMSLVPSNVNYQNDFIQGYLTYVNTDFQKQIYDEIINIIIEQY